MQVYRDHALHEYESGLTYPQFLWSSELQAGEEVVFRYLEGSTPGIVLSGKAMWPAGQKLENESGFQLDVPWYAMPEPVVTAMLDLAELAPGDVLLDLGSGDGRIVIEAAKRFAVRATGVDIDPAQVRKAIETAQAAGVSNLVSFRRGDLYGVDLAEATVVTLYLLRDVNLRIRDRLRTQLQPGSRIISRSFDMGDWVPDAVVQTEFGPIYKWRM